MSELVPSNDAVKRRAEALEVRLRRVVALVAAVSGLCSLLPAAVPEVPDVQALVGILEDAAPEVLADVQWLIQSFQQRSLQLDAILLKSVA